MPTTEIQATAPGGAPASTEAAPRDQHPTAQREVRAEASLSKLYADRNERHDAALRHAVDVGRMSATPGL